MTATNELVALRRRVEELEALVRPLRAAQAAGRSGDDRLLAAVADVVGVDLARIQGDERARNVTAARRVVADILHRESGWTPGRIARAMRKSVPSVRGMLGK